MPDQNVEQLAQELEAWNQQYSDMESVSTISYLRYTHLT